MLGVIRNLVLYFILYFVTAYMRNHHIHVILAQGKHKTHCTLLEKVSKNSSMISNLQQWLHKKMLKITSGKNVIM